MVNLVAWLRNREHLTDLRQQLFPTVTKGTLLRHYLPLSGAMSHSLFTMNIFSPTILTRTFNLYDLAASNAILFQSHFGIGFFVFFRPHMYRLNNWNRVEFSVFASVMFNFGSLLLSIFVKSLVLRRLGHTTRALLGLGLSTFMLSKGYKYVRHIDSRTRPFKDVRFEHAGAA